MAGTIRLGMAGWVFEPWRGAFYPKGLPHKDELAYASRHVGAIEINATFRQNQAPKSFLKWAGEAPEDFVFSIKGPQFITHIRRLKDIEAPLGNFFASGVLALAGRLGPIVWQLPPTLAFDPGTLESFFSLLPRTGAQAVATARGNDGRLKQEPYLDATGVAVVRHALEVRNQSFAVPGFVALLRRHNIAHVIADTGDWPYLDVTADFVYGRLQGAPGSDHYEDADLDRWAARARAWADGRPVTDGPTIGPPAPARPRDVELHFVSTDKVHAPANALALMARLGLASPR